MTSGKRMQPPSTGTVPNPDPTERTVEQLLREIATSREIVEAKAVGGRDVIETRLSAMDKAIELLQTSANTLPQFVKDEVMQLRELHDEKFSSIATQFQERDKRTEQLSLSDKTAIAAALQAQKEAAGAQNESNAAANLKMELNFAKLIDQQGLLLQEVRRNTDTQINDIKSRQDKGEGGTRAVERTTDKTSSTIGLVIAGAVAFVVVMTGIVSAVAFISTRAPAPTQYQQTPSPSTVR